MFDVKHNGRRQARMVADGHLTEPGLKSNYSGVVSLKSLKTVVFLAELLSLMVLPLSVSSCDKMSSILPKPKLLPLHPPVFLKSYALGVNLISPLASLTTLLI